MNTTEHLLVCLAEECAEVQQAVSKALRFGLEDGYPESKTTNAQDIALELLELIAVAEMLEERGLIDLKACHKDKNGKKERVLAYMQYAKGRKTLSN